MRAEERYERGARYDDGGRPSRYEDRRQVYRQEGRNYRKELLERFADMDFEEHEFSRGHSNRDYE